MFDNFKSALSSIWSNKVRSVLTVLGVVIGVTSVTTLVSLGQGLKNDVSGLIQGFGTNVITVVSGKIDPKSSSGVNNPANFINGDILTLQDYATIRSLTDVQAASPLSLVSGALKYKDKVTASTIFGSYPNFIDILSILKIDQGNMFDTKASVPVIVLGPTAKTDLFGDTYPIGEKVTLGKTELQVIGTLSKPKSAGLFGSEIDSVSAIPFDTATELNKNQVKIMRIVVKAKDTAKVAEVKTQIHDALLKNHNGEENFTVLTQDDILDLFNTFLNLATTMVSAIAAISLIVGGIGIMNIMLVTVTERTKEIGLRKAVGATKLAILVQFLTEAIMVTALGALIGLGISFGVDAIVASKTQLHPDITLNVIFVAVGISIVIGVIFGLWPALRAANKDPIEALRYE